MSQRIASDRIVDKRISNKLLTIFFICIFTLYFFRCFIALDADFGWHLATGQFILKHGIPKTDPFSYTMPSYPFINHEWLADIVIAILYPLIGMIGLSLLFSSFSVIALIIPIVSLSPTKRKFAFIPLMIISVILYGFVGLRIQVVTWIFISLVLSILTYQYQKWRIILPFVFLIWANIHAGFALGLIFLILFLVIRYIQQETISVADMAILLLSFVATLINPYGYNLWSILWIHTVNSLNYSVIKEWLPLFFNATSALWLFLLWSTVIIAFYKKSIHPLSILLYTFTLALSFLSTRNVPLWLLVSLPIVTTSLQQTYNQAKTVLHTKKIFHKTYLGFFLLVCVLCLIELFSDGLQTFSISEKSYYPQQAVVFLKHNPTHGQIFTLYDWSGYLDWKLPEKKVFVDGRMPTWSWHAPNKQEENNAFQTYLTLMYSKANFAFIAKKYHIDTVLLPLEKNRQDKIELEKLTQKCQQYGMKLIYKDSIAVIYRIQSKALKNTHS